MCPSAELSLGATAQVEQRKCQRKLVVDPTGVDPVTSRFSSTSWRRRTPASEGNVAELKTPVTQLVLK